METTEEKNRRIAINTALLYIRTIIIMLVSLFTSRLILNILGVTDYGIYNVVGGAISMFSILSSALSGAISRFITFGIGSNNKEKLKVIFATSINIQIGISIIIFILAEIIGVWFLNTKLNIPPDRLTAAGWVLQFSILSFVIGLISVPYNASIIAHEKMNVFAYMGILEVLLKLAFVAALYWVRQDKLIIYSISLTVIPLIMRIIYGVYCSRNFEECEYKFVFDKDLLKEMGSFAGWSFWGNTAYMFNTQGVNIIINVFFGVILNAARGVVTQVESAIMQFVNNFMTAITPQITKSYASGDITYMNDLVCRGAKFSFYLLLFFLIPFEFETDIILKLWLGTVPEYASLFLRLSLVCTAIMLLGNTGLTSIMATGNIKNYQIVVTVVGCLVFPLTWLAYKIGCSAMITYIIYGVIYAIINWIRLYFMHKLYDFPVGMFVKRVFWPILLVSLATVVLPLVIYLNVEESILRMLLICVASVISTSVSIYFLGLEVNERNILTEKVKSILTRI